VADQRGTHQALAPNISTEYSTQSSAGLQISKKRKKKAVCLIALDSKMEGVV